jgi:esterase/lipase superfamily enzyme
VAAFFRALSVAIAVAMTGEVAAQEPSGLKLKIDAVCREKAECAAMVVFFATDRRYSPSFWNKTEFSNERSTRLRFGRTVVTVPVRVARERGAIILSPYKVVMPRQKKGDWWDAIYPSLPGADPTKHFTISTPDFIIYNEETELLNEIKQHSKQSQRKNALVFVHGYNTRYEEAWFRSGRIAYDTQGIDTLILYSWPSGGNSFDYLHDREISELTAGNLAKFLRVLANGLPDHKVHILAQGLGNVSVLRALTEIAASEGKAQITKLGQIVMVSPDVAAEVALQALPRIQNFTQGVTLYASSSDRVLQASRLVSGGMARAGEVGPNGPLIVPGVDTIDVSLASKGYFSLGHSTYAENDDLLSDISLLVSRGVRPPDARNFRLVKRVSAKGTYWAYAP